MLSPNSKLQDRYRIIRELGHGGMGYVYEAMDERVSCIVVVKECSVDKFAENASDPVKLKAELLSAFKREAELLAIYATIRCRASQTISARMKARSS